MTLKMKLSRHIHIKWLALPWTWIILAHLTCIMAYKGIKIITDKFGTLALHVFFIKFVSLWKESSYTKPLFYFHNFLCPRIEWSGAYCFCPACLSVCLSVSLSVVNFNLRYNFWTVICNKFLTKWYAISSVFLLLSWLLLLLPRLNYSIHNKLVNVAPVQQSAT